jgi:hypothetical protein
MKRGGRLKARASNETNDVKDRIQALVREIVIARDKGCIFGPNPHYTFGTAPVFMSIPACNGYAKDGHLILQADHLVTRANSATYADTRLIVCVCKGHHLWKKWNEARYNEIVRTLLPADRVALWDKAHEARYKPPRMFTSDWMMEEAALKQELRTYQGATRPGDKRMEPAA